MRVSSLLSFHHVKTLKYSMRWDEKKKKKKNFLQYNGATPFSVWALIILPTHTRMCICVHVQFKKANHWSGEQQLARVCHFRCRAEGVRVRLCVWYKSWPLISQSTNNGRAGQYIDPQQVKWSRCYNDRGLERSPNVPQQREKKRKRKGALCNHPLHHSSPNHVITVYFCYITHLL